MVSGEDPDLALLLGDQLYALGLSRLAALGDLDAVAELADLISLVAQAQARSTRSWPTAVWQAGAAAIGWGATAAHEAAKALARAGDPARPQRLSAPRTRSCRATGGGPVTLASLLTVRFRRVQCDLAAVDRRHTWQTDTKKDPSPSTRPTGRCRAPSRARRSPAGAS